MPAKKDPTQKIRPYEGDTDKARKIAEETGLDLITVMSLALSAGLTAIEENGGKITLPLKMQIVEKDQKKASEVQRQPIDPATNKKKHAA